MINKIILYTAILLAVLMVSAALPSSLYASSDAHTSIPQYMDVILPDGTIIIIPSEYRFMPHAILVQLFGHTRLVTPPTLLPHTAAAYIPNDPVPHFSLINAYGSIIPAHYISMETYFPFGFDDNYIFVDGKPFAFSYTFLASTTGYCPCVRCTGIWSAEHPSRIGTNFVQRTSSGLLAQLGVVAVDRTRIPLGTLLFIEGYGFAVAGDIGSAVRGNVVDLFFETHERALAHGRRNRNVFILYDQTIDLGIDWSR
ncbi:MAG: 3D domain-containing protein [Defluviitaleaceae bacterium]|nr:3D domain-containing protein [Defluviitaleaceae bacterium]